MDLTTTLTVIAIVIAVIIGLWQIYLARKQIQHSRSLIVNIEQKETTALSEVANDANKYVNRPYPIEIIEQINKLPLIQKRDAEKSYVGLRVNWETTLSDLYPHEPGIYRLALQDRGRYPWIFCNIDISKYPEIKIALAGQKLWVRGEIAEVDGHTIHLVNCEIRVQ
jgi:hypothetical protein